MIVRHSVETKCVLAIAAYIMSNVEELNKREDTNLQIKHKKHREESNLMARTLIEKIGYGSL